MCTEKLLLGNVRYLVLNRLKEKLFNIEGILLTNNIFELSASMPQMILKIRVIFYIQCLAVWINVTDNNCQTASGVLVNYIIILFNKDLKTVDSYSVASYQLPTGNCKTCWKVFYFIS